MNNETGNDWFNEGEKTPNFRVENDILKLKMEAEFGASVHSGGSNLPPELEHRFLQSIYDFELATRRNTPKVTVFEAIGSPEVRLSIELNDEEVAGEVERLTDLLFEHRLVLNTRKSYDDRIIYDFIVNELFPYEMEYIQIPGYYCHFSYEDFHPDHEYDLYTDAKEFLQQVISRNLDREYNGIYDEVLLDDGRILLSTEAYDRIMLSLSDYSQCHLDHLEMLEIKFDDTDAAVKFRIEYSCCYQQKETIVIQGEGKLAYRKDYGGYWYISEIGIPGIVL